MFRSHNGLLTVPSRNRKSLMSFRWSGRLKLSTAKRDVVEQFALIIKYSLIRQVHIDVLFLQRMLRLFVMPRYRLEVSDLF